MPGVFHSSRDCSHPGMARASIGDPGIRILNLRQLRLSEPFGVLRDRRRHAFGEG